MIKGTTSGSSLALAGALCLVLLACSEPVEPGELTDSGLANFLLRRPVEGTVTPQLIPVSEAVGTSVYRVSSLLTYIDTVPFQWEPSERAERYTVVFLAAPSLEELNGLWEEVATAPGSPSARRLVEEPTLAFGVESARTVEVPVGPEPDSGATDNRPIFSSVEHLVPDSLFAGRMREAGYAQRDTAYFLWSVVAHRGERSTRSVEIQRLRVWLR